MPANDKRPSEPEPSNRLAVPPSSLLGGYTYGTRWLLLLPVLIGMTILLALGVGLWLRRRFKNARLARQVYADEQAAKAALLNQAEVTKPAEPKTPAE